jgi:hypothetical protein
MARKKRQRFEEGALVHIPFGRGRHGYGQLLVDPWIRVFDHASGEELDEPGSILAQPVLFTVAVHTFGITEGRWQVIGRVPLGPEDRRLPDQFMQDQLDPSRLQRVSFDREGHQRQRPASAEECEGLEAAAVWDPEHVEGRLDDHYAGRTNLHLSSMRLLRPGEVFTAILHRPEDPDGNWVVSGRAHGPIRVGDRVRVGSAEGPLLEVAAVKTYVGGADARALVSGQSGTLHLSGKLAAKQREERALYRAEGA